MQERSQNIQNTHIVFRLRPNKNFKYSNNFKKII